LGFVPIRGQLGRGCLMPGMTAIGAADGPAGLSAQGLFVDAVAGPANRAADDHRAKVRRGRTSRGSRRRAASGKLAQMMVGIAEHRVDHRDPFEVVTDLVLHRHPDAAMQLDRLLDDELAGTAYLDL